MSSAAATPMADSLRTWAIWPLPKYWLPSTIMAVPAA